MARNRISLLVCDLDNTLYDWVHFFVAAFYDMVDEVVKITGCNRERLLDDFRTVHQNHHDSEHPFSLLETRTIRNLFPHHSRQELAKILDPALHAFNSRRKRELQLHSGVRETLDELRQHNIILVAHTESKLYGVVDRLSRLDLTDYFSRIYCRERPASFHPDPDTGTRWLSHFPMHKVVELSHHQKKPDPSVLLEICNDFNLPPTEVAYVGDSMARDILMAKRAAVFAIWAKYGAQHSEIEYKKLVRISHWTSKDVEQELRLKSMAQTVQPNFIANRCFSEVLTALGFPNSGRR